MLSVIRAADLTKRSAIANGTRYALTGGLFSRSPAHIERVRREFRVGNLYINRKITGALVDRQPFGGFKLSGIGPKAGGPDYLPQFLRRPHRHGKHPAARLRAEQRRGSRAGGRGVVRINEMGATGGQARRQRGVGHRKGRTRARLLIHLRERVRARTRRRGHLR